MNIFRKNTKAIRLPEKSLENMLISNSIDLNKKGFSQKNINKRNIEKRSRDNININKINIQSRRERNNKKRKNLESKNNIKNKNKLKSKKELKTITYIIIIAIICMLFLTGYSIGKTISETLIQTTGEVAEPILELKTNEKLNITATENSGEYSFQVTNYKENKITEVPIQYTIEIISNTDESIKYELYKDNEKIELQNQKTNILELKANEMQEDNYILKISYDKNQSNSIYDIIEKIQIKIHSEQKEI